MLLPREKKILELLYRKKEFTTMELANVLHISPRTIKSDIKRIIEELKKKGTGCTVNTKTGRGIWISYNEKGKQYLNNLLMEGDSSSFFLPETRKYYVALKLLDEDDFISMESIAQSMYVSKGTIVNCINELIPFFERQGLLLEKKVKYGIHVLGEEKQLRIARAAVIHRIIPNQGNHISNRLQPFFEGINLESINEIIQDAEKKFEFILADTVYSEMVIQLAIIVERIKKGKICTITETELTEYSKRKEWEITGFLSKRLEEVFKIQFSSGERSYLMMNLSGLNTRNKIVGQDEDSSNEETDDDYLKMWEEILEETGKVYRENLAKDNVLKCTLFMHLKAMFNRIRHQIHLANPMNNMVKEELVYEMEVASYMARLIGERFGLKVGEDEICYIAIYLGASLEREKAQRGMGNPAVSVVCGSGLGTSQFIEARLKRIFPNITISKILPIKRAEKEISPGSQDFVISTVPLVLDRIDVINISPMLTENDVMAIERRLNQGKSKLTTVSKGKYSNFLGLLNDKISIFKCDCKSREEAISLMGNRLFYEKYVDEGFTASAFKREQVATTSIGGCFALPHAYEGHVLKPGVGLMTLKKPVLWGNEKVRIILMLSLDVRSQELFKNVFSEIAEITKDTAAIARILSAEKLRDITFNIEIHGETSAL